MLTASHSPLESLAVQFKQLVESAHRRPKFPVCATLIGAVHKPEREELNLIVALDPVIQALKTQHEKFACSQRRQGFKEIRVQVRGVYLHRTVDASSSAVRVLLQNAVPGHGTSSPIIQTWCANVHSRDPNEPIGSLDAG